MHRTPRRVAAIALGLGFALAATEMLIRWGPWPVPPAVVAAIDTKSRDLIRPHASLRYCLVSDFVLQQTCSDYNIYEVRTGALGDDGIGFRLGGAGTPPEGVVVGDSFVMGVGVDEEETLVAHLARDLDLDLFNLGVHGYGPQQAGRMLFEYGVDLEPRIVVWVFFGNDLMDAPRFEESTAAGVQLPSDAGRSARFRNTYWATYKLWRYLSPFHSSRREHWRGPGELEYVFSYDLREELDLEEPRVRSGLESMRLELEKLARGAEPHGYQPFLVLMPFKEQTYEQELRAIARRDIEDLDLESAYRAVAELGAELGIPTLDLTPALRAARSEQIYLRVDPHLSPRGNQVAARAISGFVQAHLR